MPKANQPGCACCVPPCTSRALRVGLVPVCFPSTPVSVRYQGPAGEDVTRAITVNSPGTVDLLADPSAGTWTVTVSGDAINTMTATVDYDGTLCYADVTINLCVKDVQFYFYFINGCDGLPLEGATLTIRGAVRGVIASVTIGPDDTGRLLVPTAAGCAEPWEDGWAEVVPPSGSGFLGVTQAIVLQPCPQSLFLSPPADADHVCESDCNWPWPKVLAYSDLYGSCLLTYDPTTGLWTGTYRMDCATAVPATPGCPPYGDGNAYNISTQAVDVIVEVGVVSVNWDGTPISPTVRARKLVPAAPRGIAFCNLPPGTPQTRFLQPGGQPAIIDTTYPSSPPSTLALTCPEDGFSISGEWQNNARGVACPCVSGPYTVTPVP